MTTSRTKLGAALRAKFGTPQALLSALGLPRSALDADLVDVGKPSSGGGSSDADVARAMRIDIENFLAGMQDEKLVAGLLEIMDKHVGDPKRLDDDDPQAPRAREIAAGDDDNLANVARFRAALRNAGMAEEDISSALAMITRQGEAIGDKLPVPALFGRGLGGRRSGDFREPGALAGDGHFGAGRIRVGYDYGPARNRALPIKLTERGIDAYNTRFGGSHIVTNG